MQQKIAKLASKHWKLKSQTSPNPSFSLPSPNPIKFLVISVIFSQTFPQKIILVKLFHQDPKFNNQKITAKVI